MPHKRFCRTLEISDLSCIGMVLYVSYIYATKSDVGHYALAYEKFFYLRGKANIDIQ